MQDDSGWLQIDLTAEQAKLRAGGRWVIHHAVELDAELDALPELDGRRVVVELGELTALDTAGAWLLHRTLEKLRGERPVEVRDAHAEHAAMLELIAEHELAAAVAPPRMNPLTAFVAHVGEVTVEIAANGVEFLAFFGAAVATLGRTLIRPWRLRLTSMVHHMEQVGWNALPIVGLISLLIGVVIGYQGANQLRRFGAEVFAVDLIAISILREIGILLTAIVVAGRSGSAFTAQLGTMKVREEVDALRTLGLDPMEVLVLPRMLALVITLPLLAFFADLMGLLGGGIMSWVSLGVSPDMFLDRLSDSISLSTFWVGIVKAPVFAMLIALVSCFEGLQVSGSSESVGRQTTRSVVESIFLVIVADALFSIFFSLIGV